MRPFIVLSALIFFSGFLVPHTAHASDAITRRDGFLLIWNSIGRPAEKTKEKPYLDLGPSDKGFLEITFAKARGFLNDKNERFRPNDPLTPSDAVLLLLRTRGVERLKADGSNDFMVLPDPPDLPVLAKKYDLSYNAESGSLTREELLDLMRDVDAKLASETHEVSLYSEKFHGRGTAFGETFDMNALTAAHRTFPANTLVRVTNIANGRSIIVRINDRGPFIQGREMDLSLASFTQIADRSIGKIRVRFERLGDAHLVQACHDDRFQQRITSDVRLDTGIPHSLGLGGTLNLSSFQPFVIRDVVYPDGTHTGVQTWVTKGETFAFTPSMIGSYVFLLGTKTGRMREMRTEVVECGGGSTLFP